MSPNPEVRSLSEAPRPSLRSCPRCAHPNLTENNYCGKCGTALVVGLVGGGAGEPGGAKFPRSMIVISAARLGISLAMFSIVVLFLLMFAGMAGPLGGGNPGGNEVLVKGVDTEVRISGLNARDANCSPCDAPKGGTVKIKVTLESTDGTTHAVSAIRLDVTEFTYESGSPSTPFTIQPGQSQTVEATLKAPSNSWEGRLKVIVEGS